MGLFTKRTDIELEQARNDVVPGQRVCPSCRAEFTTSRETLTMVNAALGIEGHKCPSCGAVAVSRRAAPDAM